MYCGVKKGCVEQMMKSFIHTFSIKSKITAQKFNMLKNKYNNRNFWTKGNREYALSIFADNGIRIKITPCKEIERQMDKEHCYNKVEIIVTLFKLLHPGKCMGYITNEYDIAEISKRIIQLLNQVYVESNVDLLKRAQIKRIDITKDVITPSDTYTKEIIRLAKHALLPYGYKIWEPTEEMEREHPEWKIDDAVFINKNNREMNYKIYNKKADLANQGEYLENLGDKGIVRFELSLKGKILRNLNIIDPKISSLTNLKVILWEITKNADMLLQLYVVDTLSIRDILSKKILVKYIRTKCGNKMKKADKMIRYIECLNKGDTSAYGSTKCIRYAEKEFNTMQISPLYAIKECPYIPAYEKMLEEDPHADKDLLKFAMMYNKNRGHDYIYWDL